MNVDVRAAVVGIDPSRAIRHGSMMPPSTKMVMPVV